MTAILDTLHRPRQGEFVIGAGKIGAGRQEFTRTPPCLMAPASVRANAMSITLPAPRRDGRQSDTAHATQRGACRMLRQRGFASLCELPLADGRRADIMALGDKGEIWIVEIKSSPEDFYADHKWPFYAAFCDRLYFAIPPGMDRAIMPPAAGLIVADSL